MQALEYQEREVFLASQAECLYRMAALAKEMCGWLGGGSRTVGLPVSLEVEGVREYLFISPLGLDYGAH